MDHHVKPIDQVRREAREAARIYSDVNEACPYPFITDAGRIYVEEFKAAREQIAQEQRQ